MNKKCPRCKNYLPKDRFTRDARTSDHLSTYCKACLKLYRDEYRSRKTDEYVASVKESRKRTVQRRKKIVPPEQKKCCKCQQILPRQDFHRSIGFADGLSPRCKECNRSEERKRLYGLSESDLNTLIHSQQSKCAICFEPFVDSKFHVDHDHATGNVRGLLCARCNLGLGSFKDSVFRLLQAIEYLS